jgi:hypothetical protein
MDIQQPSMDLGYSLWQKHFLWRAIAEILNDPYSEECTEISDTDLKALLF